MSDLFALMAASLCTASFIPQLLQMHRSRALFISSLALKLYFCGVVCWLIYAFIEGNILVLVASILQIVLVGLILKLRNEIK
jgi:MtN3 and saliva related transmembrane protein